jgi:hypothetical protein
MGRLHGITALQAGRCFMESASLYNFLDVHCESLRTRAILDHDARLSLSKEYCHSIHKCVLIASLTFPFVGHNNDIQCSSST